MEPVIADPARERFGALAQEIGRSVAQDEELRLRVRPVSQDPKQGEDLRSALDLVEDHESLKRTEGQLRIGEQSQVRGALQVEAGDRPISGPAKGTGKRRLADLASPRIATRGNVRKSQPSRSRCRSREIKRLGYLEIPPAFGDFQGELGTEDGYPSGWHPFGEGSVFPVVITV
jgi:hypothetical protein